MDNASHYRDQCFYFATRTNNIDPTGRFGGGLRLFAFWRVQPFASPSSQASGRGSSNMPFLDLSDVPDQNPKIKRTPNSSGGCYCLSRTINLVRSPTGDRIKFFLPSVV